MQDHLFVSSLREEVWEVSRNIWSLREVRVDRGACHTTIMQGRFAQIRASSDVFAIAADFGTEAIPEALETAFPEDLDASVRTLRRVVGSQNRLLRARLSSSLRWTTSDSRPGQSLRTSALVTVSSSDLGGVAVPIFDTGDAADAPAWIRTLFDAAPVHVQELEWRTLPILWSGGSGSVLIHELLGHPSEEGGEAIALPSWISVDDDPLASGIGTMVRDDAGLEPRRASLTGGESPTAWRRESWSDPPMRRMTNLIVSCNSASPFACPARRLEIRFVSEGRYSRLDESIELTVVLADLVGSDGSRTRVAPFTIRTGRYDMAQCIIGATGPVERYPGVACSREGQRVAVGSFSCTLLTRPLRDA